MPIAEIETLPPVTLPRLRPKSVRLAAFAFAMLLALLRNIPTVSAAPQDVMVFADRELGEALATGVRNLGVAAGQMQVRPFAIDAACAASVGPVPRLALISRTPTRAQIERCVQNADADVNTFTVGRQAVALVVPNKSPVWSMNSAALFRAIGQNASDSGRPTNWSEIDPSYPNLPIGLLLPAAGSRAQALFDALITGPGCDNANAARIPFDTKARNSFCAELRTDIPITRRVGGEQDVAAWAASAPPGQIAVVGIAELAQLDGNVVPLLLDGVLPTGDDIDSGRYQAAEQVVLLIVVPHGADQPRHNEARRMAFKLLAEASIGPTGALAPAGLIPLPPSERVAARAQAIAFLEQR